MSYFNFKPRLTKTFLLVAFITLVQNLAFAATKTWTGTSSGDWNTAANWGGTLPANGDIINIGVATFTNQPTISSTPLFTASSITIGNVKAVTLTINAGFTLSVPTLTMSTTTIGISKIATNGTLDVNNVTMNSALSGTTYRNSIVLGTAGIIKLSGDIEGGSLDASANGSTVILNGTIAQSFPNTTVIGGTAIDHLDIYNTYYGSSTDRGVTFTGATVNQTTLEANAIFNANGTLVVGTGYFLTLKANSDYISKSTFTFRANDVIDPTSTIEYTSPTQIVNLYTPNAGQTNLPPNIIFTGTTMSVNSGTAPNATPNFVVRGNLTSSGSTTVNFSGITSINIQGDFKGTSNIDLATNSIPLTIEGSWLNTATDATTKSVTYDGNVAGNTQVVSTAITYGSTLTFSNASPKKVSSGTLAVTGAFTTSGGAVNLYTNDPTVTVAGNWTNSTTVTQDVGPITITGNLTNNSGGSLVLGSADLSITGDYTNNLGGVYTQSTGTTNFNGSSSQALIDNSATGTTFNKVSFSGGALTGPKTMSGTGGFAVSSTGTLSLANNATTKLDAGGVLTLKSDASSSATVTQILNTTSTIIGNVKVERYFSGGAVATYRGYRLASSAVNTNSVTNNTGNTALYNLDFLSTSPSSIFTAGPGGTGSGFTSLGAGNSTIYVYREDLPSSAATFNGGNFKGVNAINTGTTTFPVANVAGTGSTSITFPVGNGYMLYYIGDKTLVASKVTRSGGKFADPESSTSTATGTLNQGDVPVKIWFRANTFLSYTTGISNYISPSFVRGFNLVGNPYASSIDWDKFTNGVADPGTGIYGPNLKNSAYVFDYRSKNYGVYQQGTAGGLGTRNSSHIIVSGQGFFVKVDSIKTVTAAKLTFHEGAKINTQNTGNGLLFKSALVSQMLRIKLSQDSINADDIILTFEPEAKNEYESDKDADYLQGIGSAVSLTSYAFNSNKKLAINHMHSIDESMRIKLYASASSSTKLDTLSATGFDSIDPRFDVYLIDHYKKDSIFFSKYKQYLFHVNRNDASSYGSDRFELVFHKNSDYNYHLLGFTAKAVKNGALLTWKVEKETTFTNFTIERENGSPLYTVQSDGSGIYTYLDKSPLTGVNNYRLKQVDAFGNTTYSTATLNFNSQFSTADDFFSVYPNPVITQFNIKINASTIPKQVQVRVTDLMGNTVINSKNPGDNIKVNAYNLIPGAYIVEVTDSSTKKTLGQKKLIKQ